MEHARGITRRSLLLAGAGALAGAAAGPPRAARALGLARPGPAAEPDLVTYSVGAIGPRALVVRLAANADLVGLSWAAAPHARPQLRFRLVDGRWSPWAAAGAAGHGPDGSDVAPETAGDPVWTGGATTIELRSPVALRDVRLHAIDVSSGRGARAEAAAVAHDSLSLAAPLLGAGPGAPPIVARASWAGRHAPPHVAPAYGAVRLAFVHHTDNPNGYLPGEVPAMLLAIYVFHRYVRGWNDIGYNFVVDLYGRVFEARAGGVMEPVIGAHAGGYNLVSTGVAVLGTFSSASISPPARAALQTLLAWKLSLHGVPAIGRVLVKVNPAGAVYSRYPADALVPLPRIAGHRDADTTDCPGEALYRTLPHMRTRVRTLAGRPARATLALAASASTVPAAPGSPPPAAPTASPPVVSGTLAYLDGAPIAGASVLVQARTIGARGEAALETTLAQASTDQAGAWSAPLPVAIVPRGGLALRALYEGASGSGATISEPLRVPAGAFTPAPAPAPSAPAAAPAPQ